MDSVSLTNNNTKSSLNKLTYAQIEPLELDYISMEEIIRVCFFLFSYSFYRRLCVRRVCCL
jgi:hypothetical protein